MADNTPAVADGAIKNPGKPDEAKYKTDLAEAQKKHDASKEKFVRCSGYLHTRYTDRL